MTYRSQLEEVNEIIGQMVTGVIGGNGFRHIKNPYNFTMARDLTSTTVSDVLALSVVCACARERR